MIVGIGDQRNILAGKAVAAVNVIVGFPEAPCHLQADLHRIAVRHRRNRRLLGRGQVVGDLVQHPQRDGADAEVGLGLGHRAAGGVGIGDGDAGLVLVDVGDLGVEGDHLVHLALERLADHAHAAHRLEHGGLHLMVHEEGHVLPHLAGDHITEGQQGGGNRRAIDAAARRAVVTAMLGRFQVGLVLHVRVQHAPAAQGFLQLVLVLGRQIRIQRLLVDRLAQQLSDIAFEIRRRLAVAHRLAAKGIGIVHHGVVVELDEGFQRHAKGLAVMQQGAVVIGNAPRAGIEVMALGKAYFLGGAAQFGIGVAAIERPVTAASAVLIFQDADLVTRLVQLIGRHHAGKACAQHQHRSPGARARQVGRALILRLAGMTHGGHGLVERGAAAHHADRGQELTACSHRWDSPVLAGKVSGSKPSHKQRS